MASYDEPIHMDPRQRAIAAVLWADMSDDALVARVETAIRAAENSIAARTQAESYYDAEAQVECYADDATVRIILPSEVNITPDQARRFGSAIISAADAAERHF